MVEFAQDGVYVSFAIVASDEVIRMPLDVYLRLAREAWNEESLRAKICNWYGKQQKAKQMALGL